MGLVNSKRRGRTLKNPANDANSREAILAAARLAAQARGYAGLNFRELAEVVGVKHASLYYHFPSKADLGAAVARRYWQDTAADLEALLARVGGDPDAA